MEYPHAVDRVWLAVFEADRVKHSLRTGDILGRQVSYSQSKGVLDALFRYTSTSLATSISAHISIYSGFGKRVHLAQRTRAITVFEGTIPT